MTLSLVTTLDVCLGGGLRSPSAILVIIFELGQFFLRKSKQVVSSKVCSFVPTNTRL